MPTTSMEAALDSVQVFANSAHTVELYAALEAGVSSSKALAERTGAARSTVGRILERGESRGWIESEGSRYGLTPLGRVMNEEFRHYLRTVEGIEHLGDEFQYLPAHAHELEYRHYRDATIIKPTPSFPAAPFDRMEAFIRTAETFPYVIARTVTPRHERVSRGLWLAGKDVRGGVLASEFLETLRTDPERAALWEEWAQTGKIWIHEDPEITVLFSDESVLIGMGEQHGNEVYATGVLESENPAVVSWAESLFEEFRSEAEPLTPDQLSNE